MALADIDVRALVEQHKRGDVEAFDEIVRRHAPRLLAHARMRLGDSVAAEDAVQETFLRAYRAMPRFDGDFHLQAWLHRICTNVCYDELDRRRRQGATEERLAAQPLFGDDDLDSAERTAALTARLSDALGQIPGQYREALVMHYGEDLSFREIAQRTGVSEENARARASRGRRALRKLMAAPMSALAFLVPAMRRGERAAQAADLGGGSAVDASTVSNATGLLHQVAPTLSRVAVDLGPTVTTKAQIITGAVAAAATTVAVPVAATRVIDRTDDPAPLVAELTSTTVVAAPLATPTTTIVIVTTTTVRAAQTATPVVPSTAPTPSTTEPAATVPGVVDPSASSSVAPGGDDDGAAAQLATTTTAVPETATTAPATTAPLPAPTLPPVVAGPSTVNGSLSAGQAGTRWNLSGTVSIAPDGAGALSVSMSGVAEVTEGATDADPDRLRLSLSGGGVSLTVQARGTYDAASGTFSISQGQHSTKTPANSGVTASGGASGTLGLGSGSLSLRLS